MDNLARSITNKFKQLNLNKPPGQGLFNFDRNADSGSYERSPNMQGEFGSSYEDSRDDLLDLDMEAFREATIEGNDGGELANYVNTKLIFEAGVDYESKPMVVFAACKLPDPDMVDYDRLLNLIIFRLDDFVENDYTVVLFSAPAMFKPNLKWLIQAYRRLGRKYKKNLKNLYIVHPSRWIRVLFSAMGSLFSPKFNKKVEWVDTLSQLATFVPIDQLQIPQPVYQYNLTKEPEIIVPQEHTLHPPRFFGVPIEELMGPSGIRGLPPPVADALDFIYTNGLSTHGIFRRSPAKTTLTKVRSMYERENHSTVAYALWGEHVAAAILKMWCRELPYPIVPRAYYQIVSDIPFKKDGDNKEGAEYIRDTLLPALSDPPCISFLLAAIIGLLRAVADHSAENEMTAPKLATCWAPNFVHSERPELDVIMCSVTRFASSDPNSNSEIAKLENGSNVVTMITLMIEHYESIFKDTLEEAENQARARTANIMSKTNTGVPPPKPPRRTGGQAAVPAVPHKPSPKPQTSSTASPRESLNEQTSASQEGGGNVSDGSGSPSTLPTDAKVITFTSSAHKSSDDSSGQSAAVNSSNTTTATTSGGPVSAQGIVARLKAEREQLAQQQQQRSRNSKSDDSGDDAKDTSDKKVIDVEKMLQES
ncbi:hypothetical protein H4219_005852 [Mycoemilia scoparia]|uniref:Uncharacterized protein n=1 Tax=Mycoemilia scoparia TaxID=417184 RepID=A0A9W7ZMC3_9FUNG|nr:hypothetical protein H4219_005852 [Mycoemilia scoparia]